MHNEVVKTNVYSMLQGMSTISI